MALEQRAAGEPLDDLVVDGQAPDGSLARLSLQENTSLTISAADTNKNFCDIARGSWATIDKDDFRDGVDRVGAAIETSKASPKYLDLKKVAELAAASETAADFVVRFPSTGHASTRQR